MKTTLLDAGIFPYGGTGLLMEIAGEDWFIPTDEATVEKLKPILMKNAVRAKKIPYQRPALDELIR